MDTQADESIAQLIPHTLVAHEVVIDGETYAVFEISLRALEPPAGLTHAERQVVSLAIEGRSYAEIAALRGTALRTVANQIRSVYSKLGISGRAELLRAC